MTFPHPKIVFAPSHKTTWLAILLMFLLYIIFQTLLEGDSVLLPAQPSTHDLTAPIDADLTNVKPATQVLQEQDPLPQTTTTRPEATGSPAYQMWQGLRSALQDAKPPNIPVSLLRELTPDLVPLSVDDVPDVVNMTLVELLGMKFAHDQFVSTIKTGDVRLVYTKGDKGVITTAADKHLGMLVMSIRMLRRTGCELPVEVFLATDTAVSSPICADILSTMNARCISTATILGSENHSEVEQNRFLNKLLALVFSSFDEVLILDADNLPILDPTIYFTSEPFTSTGLVAWPDFWPSSISHKHAEITSTTFPPLNGTVESGQLLISKSLQHRTLLLAFYYNFYGPDYYYPLETQGGPGAGDKETFINAALALDEPYYLVSERLASLGYWDDVRFLGPAMAQYDPIRDYHNIQQNLQKESEGYVRPSICFVHHNMLKLNPSTVFGHEGHLDYTRNQAGKYTRLWGEREATMDRFDGVDMERIMWETLKEVSCALEAKGMLDANDDSNGCEKCKQYMIAVFDQEEGS